MIATRDEMKQEALCRMVYLHLLPSILIDFKNGILTVSENKGRIRSTDILKKQNLCISHITNDLQNRVSMFEKEYGVVVYHLIRNYTNLGELITFLYVGEYKKEWGQESSNTYSLCPLAYVVNLKDEELSEFGVVKVQPAFGGLIRTA